MTRWGWASTGVVAGVALAVACTAPDSGDILEIEAVGNVVGRVYFDANANNREDAADPSVPGIPVRMTVRGAREAFATEVSDVNGQYTFADLPVGTYWIGVDTLVLGDTLFVLDADTTPVNVRPTVNTTKGVGLALAQVSIAEARLLPVGKKVTIEGFALNSRVAFGDSTIHLSNGPTAIRAINTLRNFPLVTEGDSVRLTGRTARYLGQPVLDGVTSQVLVRTGTPTPAIVSTVAAASANGGALDANHVQVRVATVIDTLTAPSGDRVVRVNDGTGVLEVVFDDDITFNLPWLLPDSVASRLTGVLVPTGAGSWQMKPRSQADIVR
ncbi:MAG: SdrD B-like domain-containing protein [Gemmatimonadota bacterium]